MATQETEARGRIPLALVASALAIAALFMIWSPENELWFKISGSLMCAILLTWAAVMVGKTKSGRLLLTRRRWKYFSILGAAVAAGITLVDIVIVAARPDSYDPVLSSLFPMFLAWVAAYLYEPGGPPLFTAPELDDRAARVWKRNALALAIIGISLGATAIIFGVTGNLFALTILSPIAVCLLATAVILWAMLRTGNRKSSPK
jgi:hypothetical protein